MKTIISDTLRFGRDGDARASQLFGWSPPEDGVTWAIGQSSGLILRRPHAPFGFFIELDMDPFVGGAAPPAQRLRLRWGDDVIAESVLTTGGYYSVFVAYPSVAQGTVNFIIEHPDAAPEGVGGRLLAFAFRGLRILLPVAPFARFALGLTASVSIGVRNDAARIIRDVLGMSVGQLAGSFINLAGDCEFGFVQRACGVEPFDLLRFAGATISAVISGLDANFDGLGNDIEAYIPHEGWDEWMILERTYGFTYHTDTSPRDLSNTQIAKIETKKLNLQRIRFHEELNTADKIFVCVDKSALPEEQVLPLFLALQRRSRAWMLWVQLARTGDEVGRVRLVAPGLIQGFVARFSPEFDGGDVALHVWLSVLANAWALLYQLATSTTESAEAAADEPQPAAGNVRAISNSRSVAPNAATSTIDLRVSPAP